MAAVLKAMDAERRDARVQTLSMEKNVAVETVLSVISPTLPQITSTSAMEVTNVIDKSPRAAFATRGRECTMYVRDMYGPISRSKRRLSRTRSANAKMQKYPI